MTPQTLNEGDIVQLDPEKVGNKAFASCLMVVTERKDFGAQGYIVGVGDGRDQPGGNFFYRARWEEMESTGGRVVWIRG